MKNYIICLLFLLSGCSRIKIHSYYKKYNENERIILSDKIIKKLYSKNKIKVFIGKNYYDKKFYRARSDIFIVKSCQIITSFIVPIDKDYTMVRDSIFKIFRTNKIFLAKHDSLFILGNISGICHKNTPLYF